MKLSPLQATTIWFKIGGVRPPHSYDMTFRQVTRRNHPWPTTDVDDAFCNLAAGSSTNVKRYDFLPFGEEIVAPINGRSTSMGYPSSPDAFLEKFTGHARDTETANINSMTGLDWMRARYYSSSQGRFQSVDPANAGASVGDPQSWNGYAYVGNNPLNYTDPDGTIGLQATAAGASIAGPVGAAVGLGVDIACAIFCAKMFGGQSLPAPKITGNGPEVWSERAPISGGGVNTGGTYGRGCGMSGVCTFQSGKGGLITGLPLYGIDFWALTGIRAKGQTFKSCMDDHATEYGIAGIAQTGFNWASGRDDNWASKFLPDVLLGNTWGAFFNSPLTRSAGTMGTNTPTLLKEGMGKSLTYGRRTSDILSLNLAGKGGLPKALGEGGAKLAAVGAFSTLGKYLGVFISTSTRLAWDTGLYGAEMLNCSH